VLLNLIVCKFEYLQAIREGSLCGLGLCKIVDDLLVWVSLLDIIIIEVNNGVPIWEYFPLNAIIKDYLFFAVLVYSLNLAIMSNNLLHNLHVLGVLIVVDLWELHIEVLLLFFISIRCGERVLRCLMRNLTGVVSRFLHLAGIFMI